MLKQQFSTRRNTPFSYTHATCREDAHNRRLKVSIRAREVAVVLPVVLTVIVAVVLVIQEVLIFLRCHCSTPAATRRTWYFQTTEQKVSLHLILPRVTPTRDIPPRPPAGCPRATLDGPPPRPPGPRPPVPPLGPAPPRPPPRRSPTDNSSSSLSPRRRPRPPVQQPHHAQGQLVSAESQQREMNASDRKAYQGTAISAPSSNSSLDSSEPPVSFLPRGPLMVPCTRACAAAPFLYSRDHTRTPSQRKVLSSKRTRARWTAVDPHPACPL
jgi:type IV secretory pathway VirB10-like protein